MKHNLRVILAKPEATYGVDSVPTGVLNAMLIRDLNMTVLEVGYDARSNVKPFLGNDQQIPANFYGMIEFGVEATPSGTAGTAPPWGTLIRGCGQSETIAAAVSVTYAPISSAEESLSIHFAHDGDLFKILGCKGSFSLDVSAGKVPLMKFKFSGLVTNAGAVSSAVLPVAAFTAWQTPVAVNKANTTFTVASYSAALESFSMDVANQTPYVNRPNTERIDFTDRKAAGTLVIEKPTFAVKDFYTGIKLASLVPCNFTHGTIAGSRFKFDTVRAQLQKPSDSESNNVTLLSMPFLLVPSNAGNEYTIVCD